MESADELAKPSFEIGLDDYDADDNWQYRVGLLLGDVPGLIYGSNRGSRNLSLNQSLNQTTSAFTFAALEKAVANHEREEMAGENGSHDGPDSVFEAPRAVVEHKEEPNDLDENSEWAQIETIMASFGAGLVRESVYIQDFQKEFERMFDGPIKPLSVGGWLESLGVGQYENTLIANGFDNLDFMGGSILEDQDLTDMGIHDPLHRKIILDATKSLPTIKPMGPGMDYSPVPHSVSEWLRSLLLSDYIPNFIENGISAMDRARELWEVDLENVLEVHMLGHRKRILASLGDRRHSWHGNSRSSISSINQDLESSPTEDITPKQDLTLNLEPSAGRQKLLSTTSEQSASLDIDLFKDYSKEVASPTSRPRQNPAPVSRRLSEPIDAGRRTRGDVRNGEGVVFSDKVAVHTDEEEGPSYQWMHQPEVLIKGCCNYTAFYLGSSLIKEPRGTESSLEACARLRRSAAGLHKIPSITLAINYIGVKFIDSKSKIVITDHEICNISHVTQDAEDLKTFAYITKDGEHERWYCHVFTVKMVDVATEIILTLGQAFEIAYQMLLKTQSHRPSVTSDYSRRDSAHDSHDSAQSSLSEDTKL